MATTDIEIIYLFDDGRREPLGTGTIDDTGQIDITAPRAGQEAFVKDQMDELNARDHVILKLPPAPGMSRYSINKRKVYRTEADFLPALKDYGTRVFAMEFIFDEVALVPGLAVMLEDGGGPKRAAPQSIFGDD